MSFRLPQTCVQAHPDVHIALGTHCAAPAVRIAAQQEADVRSNTDGYLEQTDVYPRWRNLGRSGYRGLNFMDNSWDYNQGEFEPFKTAQVFDSTAQHPEWLGYSKSSE